MADYIAHFVGSGFRFGSTKMRYLGYTKDAVIRKAKQDADEGMFSAFYLEYQSGKSVGNWVKKGSRWYKEW